MKKLAILFIIFIVCMSFAGCGSTQSTSSDSQKSSQSSTEDTSSSTDSADSESPADDTSSDSTAVQPAAPQRQVTGKATDLSTGTFTGGTDITAGLYDVTPVEGQGNFTVTGSDGSLKANEILGSSQGMGVPKVRTDIAEGDKIQLQGISKAHFEPVTTPFVTEVKALTLYSGTWKAGEDIAPGRYKAVPVVGSGNFIVDDASGMPTVNEILGTQAGGVANVTFEIKDGDVINISNLTQVNVTPIK